jgi:hypothetical protein
MTANRHVVNLRQRQLAELLILLGVVVAVSIYRADIGRDFPQSWWRVG